MSTLKDQLSRRKEKLGLSQHTSIHVRASLLFDAKDAAKIDLHSLYHLSLSGLAELKKEEPRLKSFETTLFSPSSKEISRELQTKEVNKRLDESIETFLHLISPFFLRKSSHKMLEYLIRRYSIHDFNKDALMRCIIPYHQSVVFVRMIQNMKLTGTIWEFLSDSQSTGYPPKRQLFVNFCMNNRSFITFISDTVKSFVERRIAHKTLHGFYIALILEILSHPRVSESYIRDLWPYILSGLTSQDEHYQSSSMMLLTSSIWKTSVSEELIQIGVEEMFTNVLLHLHSNALLTLIILLQNVKIEKGKEFESIEKYIPLSVVRIMMEWRDIADCLCDFVKQSYDISKLVSFILQAFTKESWKEKVLYESIISLIKNIDINEHVPLFVYSLLKSYDQESNPDSSMKLDDEMEDDSDNYESEDTTNIRKESITIILKYLDSKYPDKFDQGIDRFLSEQNFENENGGDALHQKFKDIFENSRHHPIFIQEDGTTTTLQLSLKSGQTNIKKFSISILLNLFDDETNIELRELTKKTIMEYLSGADSDIIITCLNIPNLLEILDHDALFGQLEKLVFNAENSHNGLHILKLSLSILIKFNEDDKFRNRIISALLVNAFHKNEEIRSYALETAKSISCPIFKEMRPKTKRSRRSSGMEIGQIGQLIMSISNNINLHWENVFENIDYLLSDPKTSTLMLIILNCSISYSNSCRTVINALLPTMIKDIGQFNENSNSVEFSGCKTKGLMVDDIDGLQKLVTCSKKKGLYLNLLNKIIQNILNTFLESGSYDASDDDEILAKIFTSVSSLSSTLFDGHMSLLFKYISGGEKMLKFLSNFWMKKDTLHNISTCILAIRQANTCLQSIKKINFELIQLVIPSLITLLGHKSNAVRTDAVSLIDVFVANSDKVSSKDTYLIDFLRVVTSRKIEIISSKTFIRQLLNMILCEDGSFKKNIQEKLLNFMIKSVMKSESKYSQYNLLTVLREVSNPAKLSECFPEYKRLLDSFKICDKYQTKDYFDDEFPSYWDCRVMEAIIQLFNCNSSSQLMNIDENFSLLIDSLKTNVVIQFNDDKDYCFNLQISLLSIITQSMFDNMPHEHQKIFFNTLCSLMVHPVLIIKEKAKSTLKGLNVNPLIIEEELIITAQSTESNANASTTPKRRKISSTEKSEIITQENIQEWISKLIVLLEMLQYKDDILKMGVLYIKPLFGILSKFLHKDNPFVNDPSSEYIEQLLLLSLISITETIANGKQIDDNDMDVEGDKERIVLTNKELKEVEKNYDVHLIIEFMRMRANPTIQNKALTLISHIARVFPSKVLENITSIFSFMGTSSERSEDNYTYGVITKAIDRIIPALLSNQREDNNVSASLLLSVFIDRIENIPHHRRLLLFEYILTKALKRGYLPFVIAMFLNKQYFISLLDEDIKPSTKRFSPTQFLLSLFPKLSPTECIVSLVLLFRWLGNNETEAKISPLNKSKDLKNVNKVGLRRDLLLITIEYISSKPFLSKVASYSKEKQQDMQKCYFNLYQSVLLFSKNISIEADSNKEIQKEVSGLVLNLLDEVNSLLSIHTFFNVIESLMKINDPNIKNRAMNLFNDKVKQYSEDKNYWKNHNLISKYANKLSDFAKKLFEIVSKEDNPTNKQTASLSIEILCRVFGHLEEIQPNILEFAKLVSDNIVQFTVTTGQHKENDIKVQASMILTIATITSTLGAKILPYLNKFFPSILSSLKLTLTDDKENDKNDLLRVSCLTSIQAICASMHRFLSNYWSEIFNILICKEFSGSKNWPQISTIIQDIASFGHPRVLVDPIENTFKEITSNGNDKECILLLVNTTGYVANFMDRVTIKNHHKSLYNLYLKYFDFIIEYKGEYTKELETPIIDSFITFILKLNESLFKPLFLYTLDWAKITSMTASKHDENELREVLFSNKTLFFYKVIDAIANELKDVFVSYFNYLVENMILILNEIRSIKKSDPILKNKHYSNTLNSIICAVVSSLNKLFTHDESGTVFDKSKFDKLMPVLVDQIELTHINPTLKQYKDRMKSKVIPCISQMAVCVNNDTLWKPLNHRVLTKARNQDANVRLTSIDIIGSLYHRLGEQFLVLLPESVQTLSELLEDSNSEVESKCMDLIKEIEDIIGEEGGVMSLLSR